MRETGVEALSGSTSIGASEFLEGVSARLQPEKRLMLAVLEDAVSDFQKYATATSGRGRRLFANADGWLRSSADALCAPAVQCTTIPSIWQAGIQSSMSRQGNCYDNAAMESFWSTLKNELLRDCQFQSREQARQMIFEVIEIDYNRQRLHSSLGHKSPVDFEQQLN